VEVFYIKFNQDYGHITKMIRGLEHLS